ncbi:MAG: hypothetical protein IJ174_04170, partial [Clostridia bacterium]|nr:hypothetical protein [Clostridia bacterium]
SIAMRLLRVCFRSVKLPMHHIRFCFGFQAVAPPAARFLPQFQPRFQTSLASSSQLDKQRPAWYNACCKKRRNGYALRH